MAPKRVSFTVEYSKERRDDNRWVRSSLKGGDKGGERMVNFG